VHTDLFTQSFILVSLYTVIHVCSKCIWQFPDFYEAYILRALEIYSVQST